MIPREGHVRRILHQLSRVPAVLMLGARQVGKSTLARLVASRWKGPVRSFDLEDPAQVARLQDPMMALEPHRGLVVLDEIQNRPDLFPALRVLCDRPGTPLRFLILGSASPRLLKQSSESLAGRLSYHEVSGFSLEEVGTNRLEPLWVRGGFPRSFLAPDDPDSLDRRKDYIRAFLERDLPQLDVAVPAATMRRLWSMLAHYHGQIWNASEFARSFGVAHTTVRRHLDLLTATFMVRQLLPWHENIAKRQVKAPKAYVSDSGLLHALLGLRTLEDVLNHPKAGASWEGFGLEQVIQRLGAEPEQCYFWATHTGAELDLLIVHGNRRWGFEFKRTDSPSVTPSMRSALQDLKLERLNVVHAGSESFPLGGRVQAVALSRILRDLKPIS